ncbi:hypothetical protein [Candidatus Viridilinea mediisalina]|uniref:hypothetical protein n=1 Tax=Candidatus Viridilinea mediisalina TaxID=2024553 RepID=UPI001FE99E95|nr:hypothetical protein [Candidatus Viridilinea mediisalina]
MQEYILIAQQTYHIERFVRQGPQAWVLTEVVGRDATMTLEAIQAVLALTDVYELVEFPPEAPTDERTAL